MADHPSPADLYDLQFAEPRGDVPFYRDAAERADGPTLELACGTGRVYLELLAAGVDADGIDLNGERLDRLRERAAARGLDPSVRRGDMTAFETDRVYDLVICPFNAVQHATTVADQLALLDCVSDALAPGGRFVFDTFVPSFAVICENYGEWEEQPVEYEGRTYTIRSRSRLADEVQQQFRVETVVAGPDGQTVHKESHTLSMLPKQQVELLVRNSGFDAWSVAGGFDGEPIEAGDTVQAWTVEKGE
ncbi:MAG: class I SAM-dependent methyltransferase [Halolamina sp.]